MIEIGDSHEVSARAVAWRWRIELSSPAGRVAFVYGPTPVEVLKRATVVADALSHRV